MIPYKSPVLTVVPKTLEKRLEIMNAVRRLALRDDEQLRERRAAIAALRHDFDRLRRDCDALERVLQQACHEWTRAELRQRLRRYSPDQPRVPAGNPDGGQWTNEDESNSSTDITTDDDPSGIRPEYASLEPGTQTDGATGSTNNTEVTSPSENSSPSALDVEYAALRVERYDRSAD